MLLAQKVSTPSAATVGAGGNGKAIVVTASDGGDKQLRGSSTRTVKVAEVLTVNDFVESNELQR